MPLPIGCQRIVRKNERISQFDSGAGIGPNVFLFDSIGWRLHDRRGKARSTQFEELSQSRGRGFDYSVRLTFGRVHFSTSIGLVSQFMNRSTPLRQLPPRSAWNEAMRRSMVISIGGFFVPNLLANFDAIPQLHPNFQFMSGICGAAGVFFATMGLFLGYFHQNWIQGTAAAIAGLVFPYAATWFWFRVTQPSAFAELLQLFGPTVITSMATYFAFALDLDQPLLTDGGIKTRNNLCRRGPARAHKYVQNLSEMERVRRIAECFLMVGQECLGKLYKFPDGKLVEVVTEGPSRNEPCHPSEDARGIKRQKKIEGLHKLVSGRGRHRSPIACASAHQGVPQR